jgi:hypothetical protein
MVAGMVVFPVADGVLAPMGIERGTLGLMIATVNPSGWELTT